MERYFNMNYIYIYIYTQTDIGRKEGNVLFNDALEREIAM